jgi:riboflavin biosynthesis pyrimidine reductase
LGAISSAIAEHEPQSQSFARLLGEDSAHALSADELAAEIIGGASAEASARAERPRVVLNMASTIDGRASVNGRSGAIGNEADRELFHALRARTDGVLVGAGTARAERYGRLLKDPSVRAARRLRGMREEPLACIVSASLELDPDELPLLAEPAARVAVLTPSEGTIAGAATAAIEYVRASDGNGIDLAGALRELSARFDVRELLCEGGPHLCGELIAHGLADELLLCVGAKIAGGTPRDERSSLRIVAAAQFDPPQPLELLDALENDSYLFLRYRVVGSRGAAGS